jgi:probable F420-dependent oxidoreductase
MKVRFAIAPAAAAERLDDFGRFVGSLERLGFDGVWLSDIPLGGTLDPVVGLSFAAAATTRLKLGTNLVPLGRHPLILAKSLAQLDQLSAGRLLLSFVVGIDQPGEREVLGVDGGARGLRLEDTTRMLRAWWAGKAVDHAGDGFQFSGVTAPVLPVQQPLEIWFGGRVPAALRRAGRLADGWLGAAITPTEAETARERIQAAAADTGRQVDPEHFGLSIPYAPRAPDPAVLERFQGRRPDVDLADLLPVGPAQMRALVARHVDAGLSKFVVRPVGREADGDAELQALGDVLLPLQT